MPVVRAASHAGTWYDSKPEKLERSISTWLQAPAMPVAGRRVRAIIGPHAGYSYCGHVMAYAYKGIDPSTVYVGVRDSQKRVFLLGPSHHVYTRRCMLSPASSYNTPLGNVSIDQEVYAALKATGKFEIAKPSQDEDEHSLELHCPYIVHTMNGHEFKLVPIIVGAISQQSEAAYGQLLAPYLEDPSNLFVISSDFCHWGSRFQYTLYDPSQASAFAGAIHESIRALDARGMAAIETGNPAEFEGYLKATGNTICGRHPIAVLMQALAASKLDTRIEFTKYDQSSSCTRPTHSSVSYASATVTTSAS